jgi:hypothetical protein
LRKSEVDDYVFREGLLPAMINQSFEGVPKMVARLFARKANNMIGGSRSLVTGKRKF